MIWFDKDTYIVICSSFDLISISCSAIRMLVDFGKLRICIKSKSYWMKQVKQHILILLHRRSTFKLDRDQYQGTTRFRSWNAKEGTACIFLGGDWRKRKLSAIWSYFPKPISNNYWPCGSTPRNSLPICLEYQKISMSSKSSKHSWENSSSKHNKLSIGESDTLVAVSRSQLLQF